MDSRGLASACPTEPSLSGVPHRFINDFSGVLVRHLNLSPSRLHLTPKPVLVSDSERSTAHRGRIIAHGGGKTSKFTTDSNDANLLFQQGQKSCMSIAHMFHLRKLEAGLCPAAPLSHPSKGWACGREVLVKSASGRVNTSYSVGSECSRW